MKQLCFLFLCFTSFVFASSPKPIPSAIKDVTVFVDGAQITRHATILLSAGTTEFSFTKLSPHILENSIQISGLNDASIISINYAINHLSKLDKSETINQLKAEIERLKDAVKAEEDIMSGYQEELNIIKENRKLGNENQVVSLEKLKQFAAYYRTRITEINTLINKSLKNNRDYNEQIGDIKKQLQELHVDDKIQSGEIKAKFHTNASKQLNLVIRYNVKNAGWFPIYDLKAKDINKPIDLHYKAHVYQNTGIRWDNVSLTLSTNDPNTNNLKPEMNTKYLNFVSQNYNYNTENATKRNDFKHNPFVNLITGTITDESGMPLPGASVILKGTSIGTSTDFVGNFSIEPQGAEQLEISYVGYVSEIISIHSSVINISLQEDVSRLEEVVVVGYGTNAASALTGSVAGVTSSNIKIRGAGTFKFKSKPLYVIDGVTSTENAFKKLDEDRIASVDVLKDEAAKAIYGSRGSDGVIIITTKKGNLTFNGDVIKAGITNTNFEIQKLTSVESDGNITVIDIDKYTVPATFSYFAAPVINENVFLTAKIGDWQQYNLLPGEVNVYFEDSYSGITTINPYAITDSLTVSLGIDPNVAIKRKPINNYKKNTFIGHNKVIEKAYKIELKNNKPTAIDIVILDRIPVSEDKEIKVDDIETGTSDYNSKKGILKWKTTISPNQSESYKFSYTLKYPRYRNISL
ncbi:mucoidy inhibitor MuiA family protein [Algibacter amylolyticus]|uniref:Mucoidy inhibitor MuiA family protein n=1 Tax=Algibacter amylolyticus TaxID=1608400 RepID=A0A5M7B833_9FLAO|nr:mucoidy inhibitor MuiA family protein [Algibacter amylolyticus]KAA5825706.1 mucoidy inhibitor MuiA family protein [Algibacter amylolyticus]MBB5268061.1 TonB-dependent SusC/RagA subfamily outer membrane receptor [Algibacter amylolyticus]TSJ80004.1 mucoidy inhibitor MuiA family protein [Algibacter amylolyticus]